MVSWGFHSKTLKSLCYNKYMATTDDALKRLEATGKIDTLGTTNPGWLIDLYNQRLEQKKEKEKGTRPG